MTEDPSFLGRGWRFPPRFGAGGRDVAMVAGVEDIRESLEILFATEIGERVMREDFGCSLASFVFEEIDRTLLTRLRAAVADAILYHETRIRLDGIDITENRDVPGLLQIAIHYTVRATNSRFNMVYPFYVKEATAAGR
ncbi:MAG: GPW/gp25 family protein [Rhodospirillales bacterium]|jgi:hypothetical protein|nr:GPW/gp25 family protein [Rhodospirillales bacterium]